MLSVLFIYSYVCLWQKLVSKLAYSAFKVTILWDSAWPLSSTVSPMRISLLSVVKGTIIQRRYLFNLKGNLKTVEQIPRTMSAFFVMEHLQHQHQAVNISLLITKITL